MKTTTKQAIKVVYNTETNMLTYLSANNRPLYGLSGQLASQKFIQACKDGLMVTIENNDKNKKENMEKKQLIRQFHAALAAKGLMDIKEDILASYGVDSSTKLNVEQLRQVVDKVNATDVRQNLRKERSIVLLLLSKLGITGSKEEGWDRLNAYLCSPKIAGKKLYEMNAEELRAVTVKLRSILYKLK
ncbi:MAG: hypothetical protein RR328_04565 [Bacteroidales bacterium]